jgi:uncharacterized protein
VSGLQIGFPWRTDGRQRTAEADQDAHVRELIEQVLFTSPGERVNRPTFGSGLLQLVFAPNSDALTAATELTVQGALQQALADLIEVRQVEVAAEDATLQVTVGYVVRRTQLPAVARFTREA